MNTAPIIALLESRLAHLTREADTNKRSHYAEICKWRKLEAVYILEQIRKLTEAKP